MDTRFFLIVTTYSREMGYRKNISGPYTTYEDALEVSDSMEGGEVVELPARTLDEAIRILSESN